MSAARAGTRAARRVRRLVPVLLAGAAAAACPDTRRPEPLVQLSGGVFGTTWHVRVRLDAGDPAPAALADSIRSELAAVDARMSGWRDDSELSRFNASGSTAWCAVSADTARVVREALAVHRRSEGAFDPTVRPLVRAWGFGGAAPRARPPSPARVRAALARVDAGALVVRESPPALRKSRPDLALDLSGLAKGFAVDAVARRLEAAGLASFLVEVGGELRARGAGPAGGPWPVAVERPQAGARRPALRLALADEALATSGDYRQRFEWRGRRYGHVLDPRTGQPVDHGLVSVSVVAPEAVQADAWATALLVLGPEAGWRVARREGLAALFVSDGAGDPNVRATPSMQRRRSR